MDTLIKVDLWIVSFFELIANFTTRAVGWNSFTLARISAAVSAIMFAFTQDVAFILIAVNCALFFFIFSHPMEKQVKSAQERGCANPYKFQPQYVGIRLTLIAVASFTLLVISIAVPDNQLAREQNRLYVAMVWIGCLMSISNIYFTACDLPPPAKSTLRKWVESLFAKPLAAGA